MCTANINSGERSKERCVSLKTKRVLIGKVGLDGHDRGAKVLALALRDAGMEVVYTGLRQTPETIVRTAIDEDVDLIGLSFMSGTHMVFVPKIMKLLEEGIKDEVKVVVGGTIPNRDLQRLKDAGVAEIFQVGTTIRQIVTSMRQLLA